MGVGNHGGDPRKDTHKGASKKIMQQCYASQPKFMALRAPPQFQHVAHGTGDAPTKFSWPPSNQRGTDLCLQRDKSPRDREKGFFACLSSCPSMNRHLPFRSLGGGVLGLVVAVSCALLALSTVTRQSAVLLGSPPVFDR